MAQPAWIAAKSVTMTYNGTNLSATDCEYSHEIGEVDVTNLNSAGNYEFITDIKKRQLRGTIVNDSNALVTLTLGSQVTASYTATGGVTHSGTAAITNLSERGGPRGAYTWNFTCVFTGAVTNS